MPLHNAILHVTTALQNAVPASRSVRVVALAGAAIVALTAYSLIHTHSASNKQQDNTKPQRRSHLREVARVLRPVAHPCGAVCIEAFDRNTDFFAQLAASYGKKIRLATKSVRVPWLIERVLARYPDVFIGLMCMSVDECAFWVQRSVKDVMIGYPTVSADDVRTAYDVQSRGGSITLMVDCVDHVDTLLRAWQHAFATATSIATASGAAASDDRIDRAPMKAPPLRVCLDVDMSYRVFGLHLGAHRSPCRTIPDVEAVVQRIKSHGQAVQLVGVMGYEAQVAGVPDENPHTPGLNGAIRMINSVSMGDVAAKRADVLRLLQHHGIALEFFNGGGSGNAELACRRDAAITEITVGSGLLQSQLFDYFVDARCEPALYIALSVTRSCEPGVVTCQSGGFIASGAVSRDKSPTVVWPPGMREFDNEGFGEVQTPLVATDEAPSIGDCVLLRPAKAGEIAERFNEYLVLGPAPRAADTDHIGQSAKDESLAIVDRVPTYRGLGHAFY